MSTMRNVTNNAELIRSQSSAKAISGQFGCKPIGGRCQNAHGLIQFPARLATLRIVFLSLCSLFLLIACSSKQTLNQSEKLVQLSDITSIPVPSAPGAMAPRLNHQGGRLTLSWLEAAPEQQSLLNGNASRFNWSRWDGMSWTPVETIAMSPQMFSNAADRPSVVIARDGTHFAHWLDKANSSVYGYDVKLARYSEQDKNWQSLGPIWTASTSDRRGYDGFVTMLPDQHGITAFWIDGRLYDEKQGGPMRLLTARISDQIHNETILDDNICSCCDTAAVQTANGPVVFYRGRTENEIRDILRVRWTGRQWSQPEPVARDNWHIEACAVDGPQAAVNEKHIALAWFTGATGQGSVKIAFSSDQGQTFMQDHEVDHLSRSGPVGHADVIFLENGDALVSWIARSQSTQNNMILLRRFAPDGTAGPYLKIAEISTSRRIGFPQLEQFANAIYLAWTEPLSQLGRTQSKSIHDKVNGLKIIKISAKSIPELTDLN